MSEPTVDLARQMPHPWSRDPVAQAAVRAAEDDAANWRRLEVGEVIEKGDKFQMKSGEWLPTTFVGRTVHGESRPYRRRRVPPPDHRELPGVVAELRERVAQLEDHCRVEAEKLARLWKSHEGVMAYEDANVPPAPESRPAETRLTQAERVQSQAEPWKWWNPLASSCGALHPTPDTQPAPAQITEGDTLATVRDPYGRPMPKGPPPGLQAKNHEAAPASRDAVNANGLRTERVTLEVTHKSLTPASEWEWKYHIRPRMLFESVRVVEEIAIDAAWLGRVTAERDAALRERDAAKEECERLRAEKAADWKAACESALAASKLVGTLKARVAELESALNTAPAANAGGGSKQPWPMAFAVWGRGAVCGVSVSREDASAMQREFAFDTEVRPLYAAPQPPRGWLTEKERGALKRAFDLLCDDDGDQPLAGTVQRLLARSTPPRVKKRGPWTISGVPGDGSQAWKPMIDTILSRRDDEWIAAIREAGGEVGE